MTWGRPLPRGSARSTGTFPAQKALLAGLVLVLSVSAIACRTDKVESLIDVPMPAGLRQCADQYEDGKVIDYSSEGDFSRACQEHGQLMTPVPVELVCSDGPPLLFNDYAWGYQGDVMTLFEEDDTVRMPSNDEIMRCLRRPGENVESS